MDDRQPLLEEIRDTGRSASAVLTSVGMDALLAMMQKHPLPWGLVFVDQARLDADDENVDAIMSGTLTLDDLIYGRIDPERVMLSFTDGNGNAMPILAPADLWGVMVCITLCVNTTVGVGGRPLPWAEVPITGPRLNTDEPDAP